MTEIIADDNRRGHVDWASILAGAAIAAGAWVVFTSFTAAIGLGSVSPEEGEGLGTFAAILVGLLPFWRWSLFMLWAATSLAACVDAAQQRKTRLKRVTGSTG